VLRRLLLLPLLAPLLALLGLGALNPQPSITLRLLTWNTAPLPLGAWIALAGAGGAALSAGATSLALGQGALPLRRQLRRRIGSDTAEAREEPAAEPFEPLRRRQRPQSPPADWAAVGGSRQPGEPAPTVSVPFRVLRRGQASTATSGGERAAAGVPEPVLAREEWDATASDDW
jgi:hypothetical protein